MKLPVLKLRSAVFQGWLMVALFPWPGLASPWLTNSIPVPNGSFESPTTPFVTTDIDYWQKTDKPPGFDESGGFLWIDETGIFLNPAVGAPDSIVNCDGLQAIYLFSFPDVGLFQDYDSTGSTSTDADHRFTARFEVGKSYQLTVGINAGPGSQLRDGATLELALYYRDSLTNRITVVSTNIVHSTTLFPDHIHLHDFSLATGSVQDSDQWAGKHLGIGLFSTVTTDLYGGYWDVDNIRLQAIELLPPIVSISRSNSGWVISFPSSADCQYQLQLADSPGAGPDSGTGSGSTVPNGPVWKNLGNPITSSETFISIPIENTAKNRCFYRVQVSARN